MKLRALILKNRKWLTLLKKIKIKKQKKHQEKVLLSIKKTRYKARKLWWAKRRKIKRRLKFCKKIRTARKRHRKWRFNKVLLDERVLPFSRKITIQIKQNNIFFNVQNLFKKKVILVGSVGKYRIRTSRKLLRWVYERIFHRFFWEAKKTFNRGGLIVVLTVPKRLRKWILRLVRTYRMYRIKKPIKQIQPVKVNKKIKKKKWRGKFFKKKKNFVLVRRPLLIKILDKKTFNGCRFAKKRRKKRKPRRLKK